MTGDKIRKDKLILIPHWDLLVTDGKNKKEV